jgi:5-methylcytosine-specific restriction endonuclease McrA
VGYPLGVHGERAVPSVIADHVIPFQWCGVLLAREDYPGGDPWSIENGQGLCRTCDNQKRFDDLRQEGERGTKDAT